MRKMTSIQHDWIGKAVELDAAGVGLTEIGRRLGVHRSSVYRALVRARGKGKRQLKKDGDVPKVSQER
jgi:DNA-directed RNA polymerase specialized sigma24 family protein